MQGRVTHDDTPGQVMTQGWPAVSYDRWVATCDTLHAHTQVLGKLAVQLAPPEPQLQHAALRLTARGWETAPLAFGQRLRQRGAGRRASLARRRVLVLSLYHAATATLLTTARSANRKVIVAT
jgi:Family of unknown function (DUF5996)